MISTHRLEDALHRGLRPAVRRQVLEGEAYLVAALLDRRADRQGLVVRRRLLAPQEQVLAGLLGLGAERDGVVPGLGRRPAVLLEQARGVPHGVHGQHVVERRQLAVEGAGCLHATEEGVADRGALEVGGVEDVTEVLELVEDRAEADRVLTGVVDQVRRVTADEARLELLGDLGGRRHLHRRAGEAVLHDRGRERHVVGAVAAVEDDRVGGGVLDHAERVVGTLGATLGAAVAVVVAAAGAGGERAAERDDGGRGERSPDDGAPVEGPDRAPAGVVDVHLVLPSGGVVLQA